MDGRTSSGDGGSFKGGVGWVDERALRRAVAALWPDAAGSGPDEFGRWKMDEHYARPSFMRWEQVALVRVVEQGHWMWEEGWRCGCGYVVVPGGDDGGGGVERVREALVAALRRRDIAMGPAMGQTSRWSLCGWLW